MSIPEEQFRPHESDGFRIERDVITRTKILEVAGYNLAKKREGTEGDDHLSDDIPCQRRVVLKKRSEDAIIRMGGTVRHQLSGQEVIFFGLGHGFQDTILGTEAEKPIWSEEHQLWYSPDGLALLTDTDLHEVKTTRRSALKKADREAGMSVEGVLFRDNETWWNYILSVMHLLGTDTYHLHVAWIIPADLESFLITAKPEVIEANWQRMTERRNLRRDHLQNDTLPPVTTRRGAYECKNCDFALSEPCLSEVMEQNVLEDE